MDLHKLDVRCAFLFQDNSKATACEIHEQIAHRMVRIPDFLTLIEVDEFVSDKKLLSFPKYCLSYKPLSIT